MKPISFAGTCGVTNTLIGLFGDEAVFEFRRERIDHPGGEVQEDDARQILPVLAVGGTRSVSPDTACEPRAASGSPFRPGRITTAHGSTRGKSH